MNYFKFINLIKETGWLRVFSNRDIRIVKNEVLVNSPIKQYMLLGDKEGIKELKDQENLPVIKRDHYI